MGLEVIDAISLNDRFVNNFIFDPILQSEGYYSYRLVGPLVFSGDGRCKIYRKNILLSGLIFKYYDFK